MPPESLDDATLVARAQEDPTQFDHLCRRYLTDIHAYCYRQLRDESAAWDATQNTFLKALVGLPSLRQPATFRVWLFRIARNAVRDDYRSRRPTAPFEESFAVPDGQPSLEDQAIANDDRRQLRSLLPKLSPIEREAIVLRGLGFNDKEISEVLGRSHSATRMMQSRTVTRLKGWLTGASGSEVGDADR